MDRNFLHDVHASISYPSNRVNRSEGSLSEQLQKVIEFLRMSRKV